EPFENIARQFSEDENTKESGGRLGWTKRGTLPAAYEKAAFALQPGQISQPVETPDGFFIIRLLAKKEAAGPEFEAAKPALAAQIKASRGSETADVSPEELKKAYEAYLPEHILIRLKNKEVLASEWVMAERKKKTHDIKIINPELDAFIYLNQPMLNPGAGEVDLDKALKMYQKAIDADPGNEYLYYEMGAIYEQKNMKAQFAQAGGKKENDPYAKAIVESGKNSNGKAVDKNAFLKEAYEMYTQARDKGVQRGAYDPIILISKARVAKTLGKNQDAKDTYIEAINFSSGNLAYLKQIEEGLKDFKGKSVETARKDLTELITEQEDIQKEQAAQEAQQNQAQEEAARQNAATSTTEVPAAATVTKSAPTKQTSVPISVKKSFTVKPAATAKTSAAKPATKPPAKAKPVTPPPAPAPAPAPK
ncbi:MAG TPA: peptidylprolyl isomerase, partial [bacterium]|nr:peptidylprolyl isomerase [bacterium]